MKKIVILMVLMVCVLVPGFSAVTDTMLTVGMENSAMGFEYSSGSVVEFNVDFEADFAMIIDNGSGFDIALYSESNFTTLKLGLYYAHMIDVNGDFDIILTVGPRLGLTSQYSIGLDAMCDLLFSLTRNVFISVGVGFQMGFGYFDNNSKWNEGFDLTIPLPTVGIGFRF